jgi:DNA-binding XRE family transcriptional regulator
MSATMNKTTIALHVAIRIRLRRRLAGITTTALADAIDASLEHVEDIEAGRVVASMYELTSISCVLGCDVSSFFDGLDDGRTAP